MPNEHQKEKFNRYLHRIVKYQKELDALQNVQPQNSKEKKNKARQIKTTQEILEKAQNDRQNLLTELSLGDANITALSEIIDKFKKKALEVETSQQAINSRISFLEKRLTKLNKNQKKMKHPKRYFWVSKQKLNEKNKKILTEIKKIPSYRQLDLLSPPIPTAIEYVKNTLEKGTLEAKDVVQIEYEKNIPHFNYVLDQYVIGGINSEEIGKKISSFSNGLSSIEYLDQLIYTNLPEATKLIKNAALKRSPASNQLVATNQTLLENNPTIEAKNPNIRLPEGKEPTIVQPTNDNNIVKESTSNSAHIDTNLDSNNLSKEMPFQNKDIITPSEKSLVHVPNSSHSLNQDLTFTRNIPVDNKLEHLLSEDSTGRTDMVHVNNLHELTSNVTARDTDPEHALASNAKQQTIGEILNTPLSEIPEENNLNHISAADSKPDEKKSFNMNIPADERKVLNIVIPNALSRQKESPKKERPTTHER
ncbi:hypothetical protein [Enterococcus sp. ZJ1622]|uniref:hypothetical protein n=1 Tax=Enterococcus sp. ZJ1622 TaxID=2709401 RepID=UPI0013EB7FB2|nr:hypothetical protein [Enterococcus sp. ZJ1622]